MWNHLKAKVLKDFRFVSTFAFKRVARKLVIFAGFLTFGLTVILVSVLMIGLNILTGPD